MFNASANARGKEKGLDKMLLKPLAPSVVEGQDHQACLSGRKTLPFSLWRPFYAKKTPRHTILLVQMYLTGQWARKCGVWHWLTSAHKTQKASPFQGLPGREGHSENQEVGLRDKLAASRYLSFFYWLVTWRISHIYVFEEEFEGWQWFLSFKSNDDMNK